MVFRQVRQLQLLIMKLSLSLIFLSCRWHAVVLGQEAQATANAPASDNGDPSQHCAEWSGAECSWEPNLKAMTVDFGPTVQETFYAYVTPDVATFYNKTAGSVLPLRPSFMGQYAKFINLSPDTLYLWYDPRTGDDKTFMATMEPFGSSGTASYPGHNFFVTRQPHSSDPPLFQWRVKQSSSLYPYDPYGSTQAAMSALDATQLSFYQMQLQNLVFAEQYKKFTGREWLALYKQKMPPRFHMWRADSIGQTHSVETREIHFVEMPDETEIHRGMSVYGARPDQTGRMRKYRDTHVTMNLTLTVLSCAPRVFEIRNFLSDVEVDHLLDIAGKSGLIRSTVVGGTGGERETSTTRTSHQSWIERHRDFVVDSLYKRAADVLRMNEALLRMRRKSEIPEFTDSDIGVAERLQLVHYNVGEQYTPHHDFTMPSLVRLQPSRFATILFYLNDDMSGGETSFPRWLNSETSEPLMVRTTLRTASSTPLIGCCLESVDLTDCCRF